MDTLKWCGRLVIWILISAKDISEVEDGDSGGLISALSVGTTAIVCGIALQFLPGFDAQDKLIIGITSMFFYLITGFIFYFSNLNPNQKKWQESGPW